MSNQPFGWRARRAILTLALALPIASGAGAADRKWAVSGSYEKIVAADCSNCDEDTGILIQCKGAARPANVTIYWAASETGRKGARATVNITIDGKLFSRPARTRHSGLVGYVGYD